MKRFLIVFMVLGLVSGAVASAEGAKRRTARVGRTVEVAYFGPWLPFGNWDCARSGGRGCVAITTRATESYLRAKVTDTHGQPVFVKVWSEYEPSGASPIFYGSFCGETEDPIQFPPGVTLNLWIGYFGPAIPSCGLGLATSGTVRATLSQIPKRDR